MKQSELILARAVNSDFTEHSLNFNIRRYYTDINGTIVDKSLVSAGLQTRFPFFILGEFDRQGGYKQFLNALPPEAGTYYLTSFVNGNSFTPANIVGFSGINDINGKIGVGDIVHVYCDDVRNPTYFVWIVQQSQLAALSSIVANSKTTQKDDKFNRLYIENVHYTTTNQNFLQWNETIVELRLNNIGLAKTDNINPMTYETPYTYLNNILILPLKFKVDQYLGFGTYMQYATDSIQFILKMLK
jgi:hypothetical protein